MTILAAFDPGLSGAVALSNHVHRLRNYKVRDLPTMGEGKQRVLNGAELAEYLREHKVEHAVVERVHAIPGWGSGGVFRFGVALGQIIGVLQALGIPYELVEPTKWKREMQLKGGDGKGEQSRLRALQMLPQMAEQLSRKKDHNRAEALLMALWWLERHK